MTLRQRLYRLEGAKRPAAPVNRADLRQERLFAILSEVGPAANMSFDDLWAWGLSLADHERESLFSGGGRDH